jgi:hypothetical protein
MQEVPNNSEPVDLEEFLRTQQFSSRPRVYFSPFENLGEKMGVRRFVIQLMNEGVVTFNKQTKQKKDIKVFELVVKVIEDCRPEDFNQSSTDKRYRFDAGDDVMCTIQSGVKRGIDVYSTPLEITAKKLRKSSKVICTIDCKFLDKKVTTAPKLPEPVAVKKPSTTDDDFDFNFDE